MKRWPIGEIAAFVIGATIGTMVTVFSNALPGIVMVILSPLCPGMLLSFMLLGNVLGMRFMTPGFGPALIVSCTLINGAFFALVWHFLKLVRDRRAGRAVRWTSVAPLVLTAGLWLGWFTLRIIGDWWSEKHPVVEPLDPKSPLIGRWEGVSSNGRVERPVVLVCQPRIDGTFEGYFYLGNDLAGPVEHTAIIDDTFGFEFEQYVFFGRRKGDEIVLQVQPLTLSRDMTLRHTSRDTAALIAPATR
jgi:hypothetical protein